jgi:hypothetical protein
MAIVNRYKTFDANAAYQGNTVVGTQTAAGTLYAPGGVNLHLVRIRNSKGLVGTLIPECGQVDGVVEMIVKEINPLAYYVDPALPTSGNLYILTDFHQSSSDLQHRIRQIAANSAATTTNNITFTYANTAVGPNAVDISGSGVTSAASFTVV